MLQVCYAGFVTFARLLTTDIVAGASRPGRLLPLSLDTAARLESAKSTARGLWHLCHGAWIAGHRANEMICIKTDTIGAPFLNSAQTRAKAVRCCRRSISLLFSGHLGIA